MNTQEDHSTIHDCVPKLDHKTINYSNATKTDERSVCVCVCGGGGVGVLNQGVERILYVSEALEEYFPFS